VFNNDTRGLGPARARTRVATSLVLTREIAGTFGVDRTFGPAIGRAAHVVGQARARGGAAHGAALGVGPTRRRHARVCTGNVYYGLS
jgi:hypothetical protein